MRQRMMRKMKTKMKMRMMIMKMAVTQKAGKNASLRPRLGSSGTRM
jgi:hypothetical protein